MQHWTTWGDLAQINKLLCLEYYLQLTPKNFVLHLCCVRAFVRGWLVGVGSLPFVIGVSRIDLRRSGLVASALTQ